MQTLETPKFIKKCIKMKSYKVQVVVTKTMWVTQDDIDEDTSSGMLCAPNREINEQVAIDYAKGTLIEEMRNNPNRGSAKIIAIFDHDTKELKQRRKRLF